MDASANRFLEGFSPEGRDYLVSQLTYQQYPRGTQLFNEGDAADGVYLVLNGEVEAIRMAGKQEQILGCFQPGDYLGEVAVLDGQGRSTGARALGTVSIAKLPREPLLEALGREPVNLTMRLFQRVLEQLRRTNDRFLQELVHKEKLSLVGEMASSLMHDVRNPVSGIRLAADLINMNHTDEETIHCCDKIRLQCDRLTGMAGELLEFSKGETKLDLGTTNTKAFLEQFCTLNEEYFQRSGVEFKLEVEPAEIKIDSMRLLRLLQNLTTNAVEAIGAKPGGRVEIRVWVEEGTFNLTISDNGSGIPDAVKDRIFEPFVTHGKKHGTGLGMAIAQNVVAAHGGTITFETSAGQGTRFLVKLPQS